jgi:hypothetical protein
MVERRDEIGLALTIVGVICFSVIWLCALPFGLLLKVLAHIKKPGD